MVIRQTILKSALTMGAGILLINPGNVFALPVPGGTLDPTTIPKYTTPLVIPPEMPKSTTQPGTPAAAYNIAVRQFKQQILPAGFGATTVWSYGRAQDKLPANFVAPAPLSSNISFNYPAFTVESSSGVLTNVRWINELVDPVTQNYLPHLFAIDQTLHWANPSAMMCADGTNRTDCMTMDPTPYTGPVPIVTHVHGAHVNPLSDGYPEAWWLPAANNIPAGYASRGSMFDQYNRTNTVPGSAFYAYENNQPATTLWYHDHTLGMTRSNVYAGPAGFWLVRGGANGDLNVKDTTGNTAQLPGPAPRAGMGDPNFTQAVRATIREIPILIQDRSFNTDGSLFYPTNRAFFEGLSLPGQPIQFGFTGILDIPYIPTSDIAPIWNPEAFFNTMVVNGATWPNLDVAPASYRFRLLDGCNSRTLNLALTVTSSSDPALVGTEIPFYLIGSDQGFVPKVVMVQTGFATQLPGNGTIPAVLTPQPTTQHALLLGPAERADVIVNFSGLPNGTVVRMINTAPDGPFGGLPDIPADPDTSGQVMQFVVNNTLTQPGDATTTLPQNLVLPAEAALGPATTTRQVTLNEEASMQLCVQAQPNGDLITLFNNPVPGDPNFMANCEAMGGMPMMPKAAMLGVLATDAFGNQVSVKKMWMDTMTETPFLNDTEVWEIFNTTVDGHPIHLHLVRFEVVNRQDIDPAALAAGNLVPVGPLNPPQPAEMGFKDTVIALPGQVTRIKARFDIAGQYVWHCHILEHEDNEMMRPYKVRFNPLVPDFNQDGKVDNTDYAILLAEIRKLPPRNPAFDLNNDGKVDLLDAKSFYATLKGV